LGWLAGGFSGGELLDIAAEFCDPAAMSYFGGKGGAGVFQTLINEIPPHDTYISAFAGMDAVLRAIRPAERCVAIDLDPEPLEWWTRARPDVEAYNCCGIVWLRHEFRLDLVGPRDLAAGSGSTSPLQDASLDRASTDPASGDGARGDRIRDSAGRNKAARAAAAGVSRSHVAGSRVAREVGSTSRRFVFLDPPYPQSTRTSDSRYRADLLSDDEHQRVINTALALPCNVMICSYPNALYDDAFRDWRSIDYYSTARSGERRRERAWMNYATPAELHDYSFLGSNKREREKIRRRTRNLAARLSSLPPHERGALLEAVTLLEATPDP
jgi:DNA adenine methylase